MSGPELRKALEQICAWKDAIEIAAPELGGLLSAIYRGEAALSAAPQPAPAVGDELEAVATEARRYAGFYPEASDGRNTFILFAEWIEDRAALFPPSEGATP